MNVLYIGLSQTRNLLLRFLNLQDACQMALQRQRLFKMQKQLFQSGLRLPEN